MGAHQVAEPLRAGCEGADERGDRPDREPDLEHAHQCPDERLPEPGRAAVRADDPSAHDELAETASTGDRLDDGGDRDGHGDQDHDREDRQGGGIQRPLPDEPHRDQREEHEDDDAQENVDERAQRTEEVPDRLHVERHSLAREDLVLGEIHHPGGRGCRCGHAYS